MKVDQIEENKQHPSLYVNTNNKTTSGVIMRNLEAEAYTLYI